MIASQHDLPDLSSLAQTSFLQLALAQRFEGRAWAEPLNLQLLTTARLLDKAITDYERARAAFDEHDRQKEGLPDFFQPQKRGVTVRYIHAIGHVEDLVAALDRTLRTLPALVAAPELESLKEQPLPDDGAANRVRTFRNKVAHGDEAIAKGKQGLLKPDAKGVELLGRRLEFSELATWLQQLHDYFVAVNRLV